MTKKNQIQRLNEIVKDEAYFRDNVLKILFMKMGYKGVTSMHGSNEHGKDIVFYEIDEKTGQEVNHAVIAKVGRLGGGTKEDKNTISIVSRQVRLAFDTSYICTVRKREVRANQVWVMTTGTISAQGQKQMIDLFGEQKGIYERWIIFKKDSDIVELLERWWEDFFIGEDPFRLEYCSKIEKKCTDMMELRALGYTKPMKNVLDVFIEPTIFERTSGLTGQKKGVQKEIKPVRHTIEDLCACNRDYWIVGSAGSGKSTVLKHLILRLASEAKEGKNDRLPVLAEFKELIDGDKIRSIEQYISDGLSHENVYHHDLDIPRWLKEGKVILFLDGLDEIPSLPMREKTIEALVDFQRLYPNIRIIATCRDWAFDSFKQRLNGFTQLDIYPFNYKQIKNFIERWFSEQRKAQEKMLEALKNTFMSGGLPKTPMVLTLLAILFEERPYREIPANLTELYSMFTELYLGRWDASRNIETVFEFTIKDNILMQVAYDMHMKKMEKIPESTLVESVKHYAEQRRMDLNPSQIISEIEQRSRLICQTGGGDYVFRHLSFQEYFVAKKLLQLGDYEADLSRKVLDPWWENVAFFYIGTKRDAPKLIEEIIEKSKEESPYDAFHKRIIIGKLLQAAYLTLHDRKVEALHYVMEGYSDNFRKALDEMLNKAGKKRSEFLTIMVMKMVFGANLASMTLAPAFRDLFERYAGINNYAAQLNAYLIAYTLGMLEDVSCMEELVSNPQLDLSPILVGNMKMDLDWLSAEYGTDIDRKVAAKIHKRVRRNVAVIKEDLYLK